MGRVETTHALLRAENRSRWFEARVLFRDEHDEPVAEWIGEQLWVRGWWYRLEWTDRRSELRLVAPSGTLAVARDLRRRRWEIAYDGAVHHFVFRGFTTRVEVLDDGRVVGEARSAGLLSRTPATADLPTLPEFLRPFAFVCLWEVRERERRSA